MKKLKFLEPEVEVITFDEKDVITGSPLGGMTGGETGGGEEQTWPTSF